MRDGPEEKLAWHQLPRPVRSRTEEIVGARVRRGVRVWGGYGPSVTCRLSLSDGRRAFLKAVDAARTADNPVMRRALVQEERVYRELGARLLPWAPAFLGSFTDGHWHVLLLEDLGPARVPPWTPVTARVAAQQFADFHRASLGAPLPDWLSHHDHEALARVWDDLAAEPGGLEGVASLAGDRHEGARRWLGRTLPELRTLSTGLASTPGPHALLHFDTRSDNIRVDLERLRIFDWPLARVGPPELDAVFFFQTVPLEEGGAAPEHMLAWYEEHMALRESVVSGAVAAAAGFFATRAWRPPIPGLPRLRPFQRQQFRSTLAWAARRFGWPEPEWLNPISR